MSRIIIHRRKSGKFDYTVVGSDVNENIISHSVQGYGSKGDAEAAVYAVQQALSRSPYPYLQFVYMTHAQYTEWLRKHRNQLRRNRRARGRK